MSHLWFLFEHLLWKPTVKNQRLIFIHWVTKLPRNCTDVLVAKWQHRSWWLFCFLLMSVVSVLSIPQNAVTDCWNLWVNVNLTYTGVFRKYAPGGIFLVFLSNNKPRSDGAKNPRLKCDFPFISPWAYRRQTPVRIPDPFSGEIKQFFKWKFVFFDAVMREDKSYP